MRVYLITYNETEQRDSKGRLIGKLCTPLTMVSHGLNEYLETVILPVEPLDYFIKTCEAIWCEDNRMYYLED